MANDCADKVIIVTINNTQLGGEISDEVVVKSTSYCRIDFPHVKASVNEQSQLDSIRLIEMVIE